MATTVTLNGQTYSVPAVGAARTWGTSLSNYLIAISTSVLQKSGGAFTLTADANFGTTYGVISAYFKSYAASAAGNIATTGVVRLGNAESIAWRNSANGANVALKVNASDRLEFDGVAVPTISSTDTLTNKTLTSPVINTPTGLVKGDVGLGNVDNTSDATKDAATSTLTNKTLTKPIVDQIDVTQGASATTPASGKSALYVSTADSKLHVVDSSGNDVPVGSGSSGRNYFSDWNDSTKDIGTVTNSLGDTLSSSDRTANKTTWGSSNTSLLTIAKSSDTSLRESTNYLITEAGSSSGAFVESPLVTLDGADLGKPLSVRFDVTGNAADGDYQVYMCRYDNNDVLQERIVVAGSASTTSPYSAKLPTGTTKFQGFFIAGSTATDQYSLRIVSNNNSSASIRIDSIYVGPDTVVQGAAIGDWQSFSPTVSNTTNNTVSGNWRRDGDSMEIFFIAVWSGAGAGSDYTLTIPGGNSIDATKVPAVDSSLYAGSGTWNDNGVGYKMLTARPNGATGIMFREIGAANHFDGSQAANIDSVVAYIRVPIVGWSSNVTMANRAVERFFYTSESFDAAGSTSVEGISGQATTNLTAVRAKTITVPGLLATDKVSIELSHQNSDAWFNSVDLAPLTLGANGAGIAGVYISGASSSSGTVTVTFQQYKWAANDDSPATEWGTNLRWRLRVVSGGAVVGFPVGARNIVGDTSGTTVPTGYIGEKLTSSGSATSWTTNTYMDGGNAGLSLTPGTYLIRSFHVYVLGGDSAVTRYLHGCGTASGNNAPTLDYVESRPASHTPAGNQQFVTPFVYVNVTTTTTYYPKFLITGTRSAGTVASSLEAVRIA